MAVPASSLLPRKALVARRRRDVRSLSDAELIDRYHIVQAVRQALRVPAPDGDDVHGAIARANRRNTDEMLQIVDDLVRRVSATPTH